MGRPLNKKYFGNRNIGRGGYQVDESAGGSANAQNYADDRIGGEGVASAAVSGGSYTTRPLFTFTAPTIPGGVTATATITSRAKTATISTSGTIAYAQNEVVSGIGGTTWTVTKEAEQSVTIASTNNGGAGGTARIVLTGPITAIKGANFLTANNISGCGLAQNTNYYILDGGTGTTFTITDSYAKAVAGTPMTLGSTGAATNGGVGIGSVYAPVASVTVTNKGDFPYAGGALVTSAQATTSTTGSGAGLTIAINAYEAKTTVITEAGSGYVTAPTAATGPTQSVTLGAVALTTDSGNVGSATNQENAILMTARLTGGSATTVDIIRQVSTNRYKVTDGTRTGIVKLKSSVATAAGEGSVRLVDSNGDTYFATKITARKVVITRGTGSQAAFVTGTAVKWNMTAATADSLLIDNA